MLCRASPTSRRGTGTRTAGETRVPAIRTSDPTTRSRWRTPGAVAAAPAPGAVAPAPRSAPRRRTWPTRIRRSARPSRSRRRRSDRPGSSWLVGGAPSAPRGPSRRADLPPEVRLCGHHRARRLGAAPVRTSSPIAREGARVDRFGLRALPTSTRELRRLDDRPTRRGCRGPPTEREAGAGCGRTLRILFLRPRPRSPTHLHAGAASLHDSCPR